MSWGNKAGWLWGGGLLVATVVSAEPLDLQGIYQRALEKERQALEDFREARILDAAMTFQLPPESVRERLVLPEALREEGDFAARYAAAVRAGDHAARREVLREMNQEMDAMLLAVRALLEQLREEGPEGEALVELDPKALEEMLADRLEAEKLAMENDQFRARDLAERMRERDESTDGPKVDARLAAMAAAQAAQSARRAEARARQEHSSEALRTEWQERARVARQEADLSARAAAAAGEASRAHAAASQIGDAAEAQAQGRAVVAQAMQAVFHAMQAAMAAGEMPGGGMQTGFMAGRGNQGSAQTGEQGREETKGEGEGEGGAGPVERALARAGLVAQIPDGGQSGPIKPGPSQPARGISVLGEPNPGWIRLDTWWVIGPFPNPRRSNVDKSFPPESVVDLDMRMEGAEGQPIGWRFVQSGREMVQPPDDPPFAIYYAYTEFFSDRDVDLWVALGSDDNSRVWINGHLVWRSGYALKNWRRDEGFRRVHFRRGINRILYRVENGHGASGFSMLVRMPVAGEEGVE